MPIRRYIFALLFLAFFAVFFSLGKKSYAVLCAPNECGPGWYVCGSGYHTYDMCCWGSTGCPSFECNSIPPDYQSCWATNINTASGEYTCRCVKENCTTFPSYCTRWGSVYECGCNHWIMETYTYPCSSVCLDCSNPSRCFEYPCTITCTGTRRVCDEPEYCRDCLTWTTPPPYCTYEYTQSQYLALGACYYCTGDETPGYVPPPLFACEEGPSAPLLIFPGNNDTLYRSSPMRVRHEWTLPSNWGENCSAVSMTLQVDNESSFINPRTYDVTHSSTTVSAEVTYPSQGTYYWRVQACNNKECRYSGTFSFNLICGIAPQAAQEESPLSGAQNVAFPTVVTWDDPSNWGSTCSNINTNTVSVYYRTKTSATCDAPGPLYSIVHGCQNLPAGRESCTIPTSNDTEYCWYLQTSNGQMSALSATTGSDVWWFETDHPLLYQYWITSLGGSAWLDGELLMNFPDLGDQVSPWNPSYFVYELDDPPVQLYPIALYVKESIDIQGDGEESESNLSATEIDAGSQWPKSYTGIPPMDGAIVDLEDEAVGDCTRIFDSVGPDPMVLSVADVSCISQAFNNPSRGNYMISEAGTAVIYVTGTGDFVITRDFKSNNPNMKVVFVTGPEVRVVIDEDLELASDPSPDYPTAQVQAAFVVTSPDGILFEGVLSTGADSELFPDGTTVVEGPIITKSFASNRSRGLTNYFPSVIVRYDPKYLYQLTNQERTSDVSNYTGLFNMDVEWELME